MTLISCARCKKSLPLSSFYRRCDGHQSVCKACSKERRKLYYLKNKKTLLAKTLEYKHKMGINTPLSEAKDSPCYLGVYITERALSKFFDNIQRMPMNNPGYDFVCGRGHKIDVKSSCRVRKRDSWLFGIGRNDVADYFFCLAFDDRKSLTPMHVWLIPGYKVNHLKQLSISSSNFDKWRDCERSLGKVLESCSVMKEVPIWS